MQFIRQWARWLSYGGSGTIGNLCALAALLMAVLAAPAGVRAETPPLRIVALGDSLTAGYGLLPGEGLVPKLQGWLDARDAGAQLVNAGVSGDTTAGARARLDWVLGEGADALIVTLGGNDMLRGLPPAEARANLAAIMDAARARGLPVLLVGMKAPANWGPDYKAAFDAIYPDLAARYGALLYPDFFAGLAAEGADMADPASLARWMQPDGIHPDAAGARVIAAALGPAVLELIGRVREAERQ